MSYAKKCTSEHEERETGAWDATHRCCCCCCLLATRALVASQSRQCMTSQLTLSLAKVAAHYIMVSLYFFFSLAVPNTTSLHSLNFRRLTHVEAPLESSHKHCRLAPPLTSIFVQYAPLVSYRTQGFIYRHKLAKQHYWLNW